MLEKDYICWYDGISELDGRNIKAPNVEAAARKAVDIWRHEKLKELNGGDLVVHLKDQEGKVSDITVHDRTLH